MLTAEECRAKARDMSALAGEANDPKSRESLLSMARSWEDVAVQADWQDRHPMSLSFRAQ